MAGHYLSEKVIPSVFPDLSRTIAASPEASWGGCQDRSLQCHLMELSEHHKHVFLEHVRDGMNRQQAAEATAKDCEDTRITATKFKFLCRRDATFNALFEDAKREGQGELNERLERCAQELALGGHWPALKFLLTTYGENFAWARSSKVEVGGTVEIQAVATVLSRFLPPDMYEKVIDVVEQRLLEDGQGELPRAVGT